MKWFKQIFTKDGVMSSKRVFGGLGWVLCMWVLIYCTINNTQAPTFSDIMLFACMTLMGVDSVTDIWKNKNGAE